MQLVAYGAQDIYLTGNPQITFFKVVYRRHTNFSMETIEQTLNGTPGNGQTTSCTISRNGDLVHRMYVTSTLAGITDGSTTLVSEAELEIGGQKIDKHYSEWMNVWNELSTPESKAVALKSMVGSIGSSGTTGVGIVQVPLQFWFCRNPGLALPLIALQYHEVKVKVTWGTDGGNDCGINCDYIYLDTDERRRFAQVSHEYLIEQLQKEDKNTASTTHKLNFNHPVKELIWTTAAAGNYTKANIKLNGHDRFALQGTEYFQLRQPYECHTAVPKQNLPSAGKGLTAVGPFGNTTLEIPTNITGQLTSNVDADGANRFNFVANTGILNMQGGGAPDVTEFAPGQELLLSFVDNGVASTFVAVVLVQAQIVDGGALPNVGNAAVAGFNGDNAANITMTISLPTEIGDVNTMPNTNAAQDRLTIFRVTRPGLLTEQGRTSSLTRNINVYSFALKPEEHQPSGTCNFSRIDNAQLIFETQLACTVYAVNYNVLRIMSGMGGLAYSN